MENGYTGGGYVYLVLDTGTGMHKLGATSQPNERLRLLANTTPHDMILVWCVASNAYGHLEWQWKQHWQAFHVKGEWFKLPDEEVSRFKAIASVLFKRVAATHRMPSKNPFAPRESRRRLAESQRPSLVQVGYPIPQPRSRGRK